MNTREEALEAECKELYMALKAMFDAYYVGQQFRPASALTKTKEALDKYKEANLD